MKKPKLVAFLWETSLTNSLLSLKMDPSVLDVVVSLPPYNEDEVCEVVKDAKIILTSPGGPFLSRKILEAAQDLQFIIFGSVGYARIDLNAASELGIPVANNPGWSSISVAEHTVMFILVLLRKAFYFHHGITQGKWLRAQNNWDLHGRNVGIFGLGNIGTAVANRLRSFGCNILYNKRNRLSEDEEKALGIEYRSFEELLKDSDVLTIHVPLTDETVGIIGKDEIESMKDGSFLINTARKEIVDEVALAEALKVGKLAGAAIDVPRDPEERRDLTEMFSDVENIVMTPHIAVSTIQGRIRWQSQAAENIKRFYETGKPLYIVNEI